MLKKGFLLRKIMLLTRTGKDISLPKVKLNSLPFLVNNPGGIIGGELTIAPVRSKEIKRVFGNE